MVVCQAGDHGGSLRAVSLRAHWREYYLLRSCDLGIDELKS